MDNFEKDLSKIAAAKWLMESGKLTTPPAKNVVEAFLEDSDNRLKLQGREVTNNLKWQSETERQLIQNIIVTLVLAPITYGLINIYEQQPNEPAGVIALVQELQACKELILAYQSNFGDPRFYVRDCLLALLDAIASIGDTQVDYWLEIIKLAIRPCDQDSVIPLIPEDMDALIEEFTKAGLANETGDAIMGNKLLRRHKAYFYRIKEEAKPGDLWRGAFGKSGPILATQKDGVVIPAIGDFYVVSRAEQTSNKIYLDIRRLSDEEVQQRYGLIKLKNAAGGRPYEFEFSSLRDVVGRLSMFPGAFGWAQIVSTQRGEEPLRRTADLFIPVITGEKLAFQPARLEVKGLGTAVIKSLHNVFDKSGRPIQIMENQASRPGPGIEFRLLDERSQVIVKDINQFLQLPGSLSGTNYQPYFNSPPGLEEADQSQRDGSNEPRVCQNGVTLPNHPIFHWWFKDSLSLSNRSYGITLRLAKSDPLALRLRELLYEYEKFGPNSRLGRWKADGRVFDMLKQFLYRVGLNLAGMNQSQLYLFPNGDKRVDERTDNYGAVVREIYGRAVGSLMKAEPAYNMVLNNYCFNGDLADLGEYVDGPGTPDFAIAYLLHFMARLVRDFKAKELLSAQEANDPRLLAAYLKGVSRLAADSAEYDGLNLKFPDPEIFQLTQERFSETDYDGNSGPEMANYRIAITDPELSRILVKIKTGDFAGRDVSSSKPEEAEIIRVCRKCYQLFRNWDEQVLKVLGYPIAGQMLTQEALKFCLDSYWNFRHSQLAQSKDACEFKELFLGLNAAFTRQSAVVEYSGKTISMEQAITRFNSLVKILRGEKSELQESSYQYPVSIPTTKISAEISADALFNSLPPDKFQNKSTQDKPDLGTDGGESVRDKKANDRDRGVRKGKIKIYVPGVNRNSIRIIGTVEDKKGRDIVLVRGDEFSGFIHINLKHLDEFKKFFGSGLTDIELAWIILTAVIDGVVVSENSNGRTIYTRRTQEQNKEVEVDVIVGENGYIITAYPSEVKFQPLPVEKAMQGQGLTTDGGEREPRRPVKVVLSLKDIAKNIAVLNLVGLKEVLYSKLKILNKEKPSILTIFGGKQRKEEFERKLIEFNESLERLKELDEIYTRLKEALEKDNFKSFIDSFTYKEIDEYLRMLEDLNKEFSEEDLTKLITFVKELTIILGGRKNNLRRVYIEYIGLSGRLEKGKNLVSILNETKGLRKRVKNLEDTIQKSTFLDYPEFKVLKERIEDLGSKIDNLIDSTQSKIKEIEKELKRKEGLLEPKKNDPLQIQVTIPQEPKIEEPPAPKVEPQGIIPPSKKEVKILRLKRPESIKEIIGALNEKKPTYDNLRIEKGSPCDLEKWKRYAKDMPLWVNKVTIGIKFNRHKNEFPSDINRETYEFLSRISLHYADVVLRHGQNSGKESQTFWYWYVKEAAGFELGIANIALEIGRHLYILTCFKKPQEDMENTIKYFTTANGVNNLFIARKDNKDGGNLTGSAGWEHWGKDGGVRSMINEEIQNIRALTEDARNELVKKNYIYSALAENGFNLGKVKRVLIRFMTEDKKYQVYSLDIYNEGSAEAESFILDISSFNPDNSEMISNRLLICASRMILALFNYEDIVRGLVNLMKSEGMTDELVKGISKNAGYTRINKIIKSSAKKLSNDAALHSVESRIAEFYNRNYPTKEIEAKVIEITKPEVRRPDLKKEIGAQTEDNRIRNWFKRKRISIMERSKGKFGQRKGKLSEEEEKYRNWLIKELKADFSSEEAVVIANGLVRLYPGTLNNLVKDGFLTEDDKEALITLEKFGLERFFQRLKEEKRLYEEYRDEEGGFSHRQIFELVFKRLFSFKRAKALLDDGLSKHNVTDIVIKQSNPKKWWQEAKPIRDELVRDGLSKSNATKIIIGWTDVKAWWQIVKCAIEELLKLNPVLTRSGIIKILVTHSPDKLSGKDFGLADDVVEPILRPLKVLKEKVLEIKFAEEKEGKAEVEKEVKPVEIPTEKEVKPEIKIEEEVKKVEEEVKPVEIPVKVKEIKPEIPKPEIKKEEVKKVEKEIPVEIPTEIKEKIPELSFEEISILRNSEKFGAVPRDELVLKFGQKNIDILWNLRQRGFLEERLGYIELSNKGIAALEIFKGWKQLHPDEAVERLKASGLVEILVLGKKRAITEVIEGLNWGRLYAFDVEGKIVIIPVISGGAPVEAREFSIDDILTELGDGSISKDGGARGKVGAKVEEEIKEKGILEGKPRNTIFLWIHILTPDIKPLLDKYIAEHDIIYLEAIVSEEAIDSLKKFREEYNELLGQYSKPEGTIDRDLEVRVVEMLLLFFPEHEYILNRILGYVKNTRKLKRIEFELFEEPKTHGEELLKYLESTLHSAKHLFNGETKDALDDLRNSAYEDYRDYANREDINQDKIKRLVGENPDKRVLVIFGSSHIPYIGGYKDMGFEFKTEPYYSAFDTIIRNFYLQKDNSPGRFKKLLDEGRFDEELLQETGMRNIREYLVEEVGIERIREIDPEVITCSWKISKEMLLDAYREQKKINPEFDEIVTGEILTKKLIESETKTEVEKLKKAGTLTREKLEKVLRSKYPLITGVIGKELQRIINKVEGELRKELGTTLSEIYKALRSAENKEKFLPKAKEILEKYPEIRFITPTKRELSAKDILELIERISDKDFEDIKTAESPEDFERLPEEIKKMVLPEPVRLSEVKKPEYHDCRLIPISFKTVKAGWEKFSKGVKGVGRKIGENPGILKDGGDKINKFVRVILEKIGYDKTFNPSEFKNIEDEKNKKKEGIQYYIVNLFWGVGHDWEWEFPVYRVIEMLGVNARDKILVYPCGAGILVSLLSKRVKIVYAADGSIISVFISALRACGVPPYEIPLDEYILRPEINKDEFRKIEETLKTFLKENKTKIPNNLNFIQVEMMHLPFKKEFDKTIIHDIESITVGFPEYIHFFEPIFITEIGGKIVRLIHWSITSDELTLMTSRYHAYLDNVKVLELISEDPMFHGLYRGKKYILTGTVTKETKKKAELDYQIIDSLIGGKNSIQIRKSLRISQIEFDESFKRLRLFSKNRDGSQAETEVSLIKGTLDGGERMVESVKYTTPSYRVGGQEVFIETKGFDGGGKIEVSLIKSTLDGGALAPSLKGNWVLFSQVLFAIGLGVYLLESKTGPPVINAILALFTDKTPVLTSLIQASSFTNISLASLLSHYNLNSFNWLSLLVLSSLRLVSISACNICVLSKTDTLKICKIV